MTHKDMYTKLVIEYNKLTENNSLSLTEYEAAVALDKAYNAVIAQKITGNNPRRSMFESDIKSISDLRPLISQKQCVLQDNTNIADNVKYGELPDDLLYFISAKTDVNISSNGDGPIDGKGKRRIDFRLVDHETAKNFMSSAYNVPWIKIPVCYIEDQYMYVVYDLYSQIHNIHMYDNANVTYIKTPNKFVKNLGAIMNTIKHYNQQDADNVVSLSYFNYQLKGQIDYDLDQHYTFECNDAVAEEVINLAISFLLENTESGRLNNKLNMRGLEA